MRNLIKMIRWALRLPFTFAFVVLKVFAVYLLVGFTVVTSVETYKFIGQYNEANDEGKAYAVCMFASRTFEPGATDYSNCAPYKEASQIKSRKISSTEITDGECPVDHKLRSGLYLPHCIQE